MSERGAVPVGRCFLCWVDAFQSHSDFAGCVVSDGLFARYSSGRRSSVWREQGGGAKGCETNNY